MRGKSTVFSILLAFLLTIQSIYVVNSEQMPVPQLDVLGSIGEPITAVAAKDDCVYAGKGTSIIVLENNEGVLVQREKQLNLPSAISDIKIQADTLYAAAGSSGLYIIDIGSPLEPVIKGVFSSHGSAEKVVIRDNTAYLADGSQGLQIIDVTDPAEPVSVGQLYRGKYVLGIELDGSNAYIASSNDGLLIADITLSNEPKALVAYDTPGIARDVAVSGGYAYVADDWKGISIVDVSRPTEPEPSGWITTKGSIHEIEMNGNCLYAVDSEAGLRILDIADAAAPKDIAVWMSENSDISGLSAYRGKIYCADRLRGIFCFDATYPEDLKPEASFVQAHPIQGMQTSLKGKYVYVTSGAYGMSVVDAEIPENLQQVSHVDFIEKVSLIQINGSYAYLPADNSLYTVDISDPLNPICVNEAPIGAEGSLQGMALDSGCIYLVCGSYIKVFSLENPEEPMLVSSYLIEGLAAVDKATDIAVRNGTAYVTLGYRGTWIYDVSNIRSIGYLGKCPDTEGYCGNIDINGNFAFINNTDSNTIEILNISDMKNPVAAGAIDDVRSGGENYKIGMYGNYVLLPDNLEGILVVDISDTEVARRVGHIAMAGIPVNVNVEGNMAYAVDSLGIISIIGLQGSNPKNETEKTAYITIDDGPSRNITPKILDTLDKYGVKATFFVLPKDNMKDIYERILDEGHVIGNHSYSHDYVYLFNSTEGFRTDIVKARSFIYNKLNYTSTVFRFPGGTMGRSSSKIKDRADILDELGYTYFDWDVSTADTDPNLRKYGDDEYIANLLANNVINNTKDRKKLVVLMHDSTDKRFTAMALPKIIEGLKEKGYKFDTLANY